MGQNLLSKANSFRAGWRPYVMRSGGLAGRPRGGCGRGVHVVVELAAAAQREGRLEGGGLQRGQRARHRATEHGALQRAATVTGGTVD